MSPRESAPDVDPKLLNEVSRLVGFIPALRVGLNDLAFAEVLFDGAVEWRNFYDLTGSQGVGRELEERIQSI